MFGRSIAYAYTDTMVGNPSGECKFLHSGAIMCVLYRTLPFQIVMIFIFGMALTAKDNNLMALNIREGTVLQGKQPWTINWQIFCEFLGDSAIIEVYNLDKKLHPLLIGNKNILAVTHTGNASKMGEKIAFNNSVEIYVNSKGKFLLKGLTGRIVKLKPMQNSAQMLNWCRNRYLINKERNQIAVKYGYKALSIIDSIYENNSLYDLCNVKTHLEFEKFYQENIKKVIEGKLTIDRVPFTRDEF